MPISNPSSRAVSEAIQTGLPQALRALALILLFCSLPLAHSIAQSETVIDGTEQPAPVTSEPLPEPELPKKKTFTDTPQVRLRILDKVRAESRTYDLEVGHTVAYANIRIRPRACRKSSPLDDPENASFLQVWEIKPNGKSDWIFSGWMFASSPSLSAMDHAVYDVTVLDCLDPNAKIITPTEPAKTEDAPKDKSATDTEIDAYISNDPTNDTPEADTAPASSD